MTIDGLHQAVVHTRQKRNASEHLTCLALGMSRSNLRYRARPYNYEELRLAMIRLAKQYGRYGYCKVTTLLRTEGLKLNHKKWNGFGQRKVCKSPRAQETTALS